MKLSFQKKIAIKFEFEIVKKIAQIEVFGHFLNFDDRWALYLVVFLQFAGPVNVFLFFLWIGSK